MESIWKFQKLIFNPVELWSFKKPLQEICNITAVHPHPMALKTVHVSNVPGRASSGVVLSSATFSDNGKSRDKDFC